MTEWRDLPRYVQIADSLASFVAFLISLLGILMIGYHLKPQSFWAFLLAPCAGAAWLFVYELFARYRKWPRVKWSWLNIIDIFFWW